MSLLVLYGLLGIGFGVFMLKVSSDDSYTFWYAVLCVAGGILLGISIGRTKYEGVPTAIDVYRGKTTLEITYKDSIAIDSVVVFKYK